MDAKDLQELGLNKNEAKIYIALLGLGEAPANKIIKSTGFHRNIVYDNLEKLIEMGLVTFVFHEKKRIFRPSKATALSELMEQQAKKTEERLKKAQDITKDITAIMGRHKPEFKTTVYQGVNGIKEILYEILDCDEYHGIGVSNASVELLGETFWKNYIQKIKQRKIKEKLLLNSDFKKTVPIDSPKNTVTKYLSEQTSLITEMLIYGNKVAIIVYTNPPVATVIESEDAVNSFLSYFNTLWKKAR